MNKKFIRILIIIAILGSSYYLYVRAKIQLTDTIPAIFNNCQFEVNFKNGGTSLYKDNKVVVPIVHDDEGTLYVLTGAGNDFIMYDIFKSYNIDFKNKEIVIYKNELDFNKRQKPYYQIIKIPKEKYSEIVDNNKIKVRIKFAFLNGQFELIEYDFKNKNYKIIQTIFPGK